MSDGFPILDEEQLRREVVETSRRMHRNGWVANHDGNISARLSGGRLLCTPTAVSKGDVAPEWLIVVDSEGTVVQGNRRSFSELRLHRAAYAARSDIGVVLHSHAPFATGFAVAGTDMGHPFMAEPVVSLGPEIPMVPFHPTGTEALERALGDALQRADVVLLERHGVLAVGGSLEQAFLRMELVEHLAKISQAAQSSGGVRRLPDDLVATLTKRGRPPSVPCFSVEEAPTSRGVAAPNRQGGRSNHVSRPNVGALVQDALKRLK